MADKNYIDNLTDLEYCGSDDEDLNFELMILMLLEYRSINEGNQENYKRIFNQLSKYFPKIIHNIQELNKNCDNDDGTKNDKKIKSEVIDGLIYTLFKDNRTIIKFETIDSILQSIKSLGPIYGVVLMMCITYIIVKMIGIFNTTV